jgi:ParB family chromosome partitioning protein
MTRKPGLGRGLDALLPGTEKPQEIILPASANGAGKIPASPTAVTGKAPAKTQADNAAAGRDIVLLPVEKLVPNPGQPRKNFDETELRELAGSVAEYGIIQPIIAAADNGTYIIIAGERRVRAAALAGLTEVPAIVREYTDQKRMEISLIENIQRSNLNPIEEAAAYKNLMDFSGLSQDELASKVGKNRSTVANALRLLKLPAQMQKSIEEGALSPGHARALLSVTDTRNREGLYREILAAELSVRTAETRAAALNAPESKKEKPKTTDNPSEIQDIQEKFIAALGTKVSITGSLKKGRINIEYYSMDDLDRLYGIIAGGQ